MKNKIVNFLLLILPLFAFSAVFKVGKNEQYKTIKSAIAAAQSGDTIFVSKGHYIEGTIELHKSITLIGIDRPIIDGNMDGEIITFNADNIVLKGFKLINSGRDEIRSVAAVHIYTSADSVIDNNNYQSRYLSREYWRWHSSVRKSGNLGQKQLHQRTQGWNLLRKKLEVFRFS